MYVLDLSSPALWHHIQYMTRKTDDRAENPHISAWPSAYVRADNQWVPRGHLEDSARTISGFRAEQLADSVRNSADVTRSRDYHKDYPK